MNIPLPFKVPSPWWCLTNDPRVLLKRTAGLAALVDIAAALAQLHAMYIGSLQQREQGRVHAPRQPHNIAAAAMAGRWADGRQDD